jgi:hypothetical protein
MALMRWSPARDPLSIRDGMNPLVHRILWPSQRRSGQLAGGRPGPLAAVVCGPRAPTIVRYAGEAGADLLILTAAHVAPAAEAPWGVVSYPVGVWAPCAVLLLK